MDLKEQIAELDSQIAELQEKRAKLFNQWMANPELSEREKFIIWYNSDEGEHYNWIPDRIKNPLLRKEIEEREFARHQTIDLERLFEEVICYLLEDEEGKKQYFEYIEKEVEEAMPVLIECMNSNIKSFTIDW